MSNQFTPLPSSYRDPSGFVFEKEGILYRQVNAFFQNDFEKFISSGCYEKLVKEGFIVKHKVINENLTGRADWFATLQPERIKYITYPYEWSFDMLKDAALLTLQLVKQALPFGLILKDATPFNFQWENGKPIFIDSLSFEIYDASKPWIAYRQFCECFLSPLLLMHYTGESMHRLLLAYPDGIPLSLTRALLPRKSRFSLHTYLHIHLHAKVSEKNRGKKQKSVTFSQKKLLNLIQSLEHVVNSMKWKGKTTQWEDYYQEASQRDNYISLKKNIIADWVNESGPFSSILDIGGNTGKFSATINSTNTTVIVADADHSAINNLYLEIKKDKKTNIIPLIVDVSDPSPALGVNNEERHSFTKRISVDIIFALALIHHLAIGKNIPFEKIAQFFSQIAGHLLIEFVPKQDEKVKVMLDQKKDIYTGYTKENFEKGFETFYSFHKQKEIGDTGRILYLMKKHA